jgi:hypothetical protein
MRFQIWLEPELATLAWLVLQVFVVAQVLTGLPGSKPTARVGRAC